MHSDSTLTAGSKAEAEEHARKALDYALRSVSAEPDNAEAHLSVAVSYGRLTDFVDNRTKLEYSRKVRASADRALALDPGNDHVHHVLGRWHSGLASLNPLLRTLAKLVYGGLPEASHEEAIQYFREAIRLAPHRIIHHAELARALSATGHKKEARDTWKTVLALPAEEAGDDQEKQAARAALR